MSTDNWNKPFQPVKSADRVFDILEELGRHPDGINVHELGKTLGIASSSIHSLIRTMFERGYVRFDHKRKLLLGVKFYEFAELYSRNALLIHAKGIMKQLAERLNENIHLAVLSGLNVIFIAYEETTHPIRYQINVGHTQAAIVTGVGKMLLSQYSDKEINKLFANYTFQRFTDTTIMSVEELLRTLHTIRERGYSVDNSERYAGSKCYAAPIYDAGNRMIASISVSIPFIRVDTLKEQDMIRSVINAGNRISTALKENASDGG